MADGIPYVIPFQVGTAYRSTPASGAGALTATAYAIKFTLTANPTGHGALTAAVNGAGTRAANLTGTGVLSATAHATKFILTTALSGHGALTATVYAKFASPATLAGHGALSATARMYRINAAAALPGQGALTALAEAEFTRLASLTGTGVLSVAAHATKFILTALSGHGVLTGQVTLKPQLAGQGALTVAVRPQGQVDLSGNGSLSATVLVIDVSIFEGQLDILCTNSSYSLQSPNPYDVTGSYLFVECAQTPNLSDGSTQALFQLYEAPTLGAGYVISMGYSGGNFICQDNGGSGTVMTVRYSVPFQALPSIHSWWRIREAGGIVYWDYSPDSMTWTNAASRSISGVYRACIGFTSSCSPTTPAPGRALWDNFNVSTVTAAAALPSRGTLTARINEVPCAANLVGHGALTGSDNPDFPAAFLGHGAPSGTASIHRITFAANATGHGTLTAAFSNHPATLTGHGTLSGAAAMHQIAFAANLASHGALTVVFSNHPAALPGHGALVGAVYRTASAANAFGHGTLTVAFSNHPATLYGHSALSGTATMYRIASAGVLAGHGKLSGAMYRIASAAQAFGHGELTAAAVAVPPAPKTRTLYDTFTTEDLTKWTGWTVVPDMLLLRESPQPVDTFMRGGPTVTLAMPTIRISPSRAYMGKLSVYRIASTAEASGELTAAAVAKSPQAAGAWRMRESEGTAYWDYSDPLNWEPEESAAEHGEVTGKGQLSAVAQSRFMRGGPTVTLAMPTLQFRPAVPIM